jgi:hypothetical protein
MLITKILAGHDSPETAYVVDDYPYGFRLRCKIRYWLEYKPKHGYRLMSQTTNPKRGDVWNKPKGSTYVPIAAAMYLDENGHVQWSGLGYYHDAAECRAWLDTFGDYLPGMVKKELDIWLAKKAEHEAKQGR